MDRTINLLASANTGTGFVNKFNNINPHPKSYDFILKGSSGSGKSTLMKKVGTYFSSLGYEIEYFYCSSDITSLDGVRIVDKNISIIDGTAPHITEATIPKINAEIINLGDYINNNVKKNALKIIKKIENKSLFYNLFYKNLEISKQIDDLIDNYSKQTYLDVDCCSLSMIEQINLPKLETKGLIRELYRSAITPNGLVFLQNDYDAIYSLDCDNYHANQVFQKLITHYLNYGYEVISFMDSINPLKINALYLKDANVLIEIAPKEQIGIYKKLLNDKMKYINYAGKHLKKAKSIHKHIEKYYYNYLDFKGLDKLYAQLITKIQTMP